MVIKSPEKSERRLFAIMLGGCLALVWLGLTFEPKQTNFEEAAALGAATTSVLAHIGDYPIHCGDSRDAADCLAGVKAREAQRSALWLGNSQLHAVNQWHAGEMNAAPLLFESLKSLGLDLVTFSQPNANLQEHYVLFEYLKRQLPLKMLILPAVFDDTRETGLRKDIANFLEDRSIKTTIAATAIGKRILQAQEAAPADSGAEDTAGITNTLQERVERFLVTWLEKHSALWASRPEMRGRLLTALYVWRNTLLGIRPTSKRKMIRSRYEDNMAAMAAILASAANSGIRILVYIVPLRSDVEVPYVDSEYQYFKSDVQSLAEQYGASFTNLENLVPADLWGRKAATSSGGGEELDFMHFQAGGHRLLAERLAEQVTAAWTQREFTP